MERAPFIATTQTTPTPTISSDPSGSKADIPEEISPVFPPNPFTIALPLYCLFKQEKPTPVIARLSLALGTPHIGVVSFHPQIRKGARIEDINLDVWLPVPPENVFMIQQINGRWRRIGVNIPLAPFQGRTYEFSMRYEWRILVGGTEAFSLTRD
ncbi:unnamed protein product [Somion occarium]|uniref:Galectin n=1 Tax=Somion occarium TaxID=3059160 RepID=A0ABP1CYJ0_9APHY